MDCQSAISFRSFASCMGDGRLLGKIDAYIQEHLLEVSDQEDFLKLPRLKVRASALDPPEPTPFLSTLVLQQSRSSNRSIHTPLNEGNSASAFSTLLHAA